MKSTKIRTGADGIIKREYFERIDSLRGLAALSVAVGHILIASADTRGLHALQIGGFWSLSLFQKIVRLLLIIFNGEAAVMCFFVISGFVLYKSLEKLRKKERHWIAIFYKKRVFRIYPALIVSYIFLGLYLQGPTYQFAEGVLLWGIGENSVTWTLKVELVMMLCMPFLYWLFEKRLGAIPIIIAAIVFATYNFNVNTLLPLFKLQGALAGQMNYIARTSVYILPFTLGMYGYRYYEDLRKLFAKPYMFLTGMIILLSTGFFITSDSYYSVLIESLGGFVIVVGCNDTKLGKFLSLRPTVWLGKISYSFYLYHTLACYFYTTTIFSVIGLAYPLPNTAINLALASIITIFLSGAFGWLSYRYIESPFLSPKQIK
jgi:peptidoglycan/LPS O-acetylase OafA/YrhL